MRSSKRLGRKKDKKMILCMPMTPIERFERSQLFPHQCDPSLPKKMKDPDLLNESSIPFGL
jgi:hypothetical protein